MLVKKLVISAAAGAIVLASAAGAFAWGGTYVHNSAHVDQTVVTVSNTGLNLTGAFNSGNTNGTANVYTGETEHAGHTGAVNGGLVSGGATAAVTTGNSFAGTYVKNTVNTTVVGE